MTCTKSHSVTDYSNLPHCACEFCSLNGQFDTFLQLVALQNANIRKETREKTEDKLGQARSYKFSYSPFNGWSHEFS